MGTNIMLMKLTTPGFEGVKDAKQSASFTSETMRVFTESEADRLVQGLGEPPG